MKGLKLLTSLLAVGAVSTIFAAASFATDFTATASYTAGADGVATVSITELDNYTADNTVGDYTIVILNADVENPTDENIVYVMQGTKEEISTAKFANLAEDGTTYYVRIGGSSQGIAKATFPVGSNPEEPDQIYIGDVNNKDGITPADAAEVLKKCGNKSSTIDANDINYYAAAYCNGDATVTPADAAEILKFCGNKTVKYVGTTVDSGTYGTKE